jgi:hypothetical protein
MSSTVHLAVSSVKSAASASATTATPIGVFQGQDPFVYSTTDPLILFTVQVCLGLSHRLILKGLYHYCDMSSSPLASFQNPTAPSHRRGYRYLPHIKLYLIRAGGILLGPSYVSFILF